MDLIQEDFPRTPSPVYADGQAYRQLQAAAATTASQAKQALEGGDDDYDPGGGGGGDGGGYSGGGYSQDVGPQGHGAQSHDTCAFSRWKRTPPSEKSRQHPRLGGLACRAAAAKKLTGKGCAVAGRTRLSQA